MKGTVGEEKEEEGRTIEEDRQEEIKEGYEWQLYSAVPHHHQYYDYFVLDLIQMKEGGQSHVY